VAEHLRGGFFEKYEKLPTAFCHGDYHPLNIIWSENGIASVIDWEFCGQKIELYDVANMVSCLGMENPNTLKKQIVIDFISKLKESKVFENESWENFVDLVLAIRFAWLSEWLRFKDANMIQLEIDYMQLLLENRNFLKQLWGLKK
jgi:homoserine kinase type II